MDREGRIMARLQEHYDYLVKQGYEIVAVILQGSQNYDLDIYDEDYKSDIDSKAIVLPSFDDFVHSKKPVSYTYILDNDEHIDVKDIRTMCEMWKKENISYIELLYSDFKIVNPEYKEQFDILVQNRDNIVNINKTQFMKCFYGMALEKRKALTHPYPATIEKIEKYGCDNKQLHHIIRLHEFFTRYTNGELIKDCYKSKRKDFLSLVKKNISPYTGKALMVEESEGIADYYLDEIKQLKEKYCTNEIPIDTVGIAMMDTIIYDLLVKYFKNFLKNT